jgi:hypothetical protein
LRQSSKVYYEIIISGGSSELKKLLINHLLGIAHKSKTKRKFNSIMIAALQYDDSHDNHKRRTYEITIDCLNEIDGIWDRLSAIALKKLGMIQLKNDEDSIATQIHNFINRINFLDTSYDKNDNRKRESRIAEVMEGFCDYMALLDGFLVSQGPGLLDICHLLIDTYGPKKFTNFISNFDRYRYNREQLEGFIDTLRFCLDKKDGRYFDNLDEDAYADLSTILEKNPKLKELIYGGL